MAHQAGAYPGFRSMKRLGVFLLPPGWDASPLVHRRVTLSSKFAGTHFYTWVERGTMGVKCLAQEHNAVPRPGLEPGPFDPESSALTIRPARLAFSAVVWCIWSVLEKLTREDFSMHILKRVAKGFCVTRDGPKISSVMRDGAKISRVMRDWTSQRDA